MKKNIVLTGYDDKHFEHYKQAFNKKEFRENFNFPFYNIGYFDGIFYRYSKEIFTEPLTEINDPLMFDKEFIPESFFYSDLYILHPRSDTLKNIQKYKELIKKIDKPILIYNEWGSNLNNLELDFWEFNKKLMFNGIVPRYKDQMESLLKNELPEDMKYARRLVR